MENDLKGNKNYFELARGSSCRGFKLPVVDCIRIGAVFLALGTELLHRNRSQELFPSITTSMFAK